MLEKWLIGIVISFILRQLAKFQSSLDWTKVKADAEARVRALVPGTWFDQEAADICKIVLDAAEKALSSTTDLQAILQCLATSNWNGAYDLLKDLLLKIWAGVPMSPTELKAKSLVAAA
jgi:hypothetical protein